VIDVKFARSPEFDIKVKLDTLFSEENKLFGKVVIAVDSRCNVVNDVKFWNEDGTDPAGIFPSPITCSDCIPLRLPRSAGNTEGMPGKVRVKELTLPEVSQVTPCHVQKFTFVAHPPFPKVV